MTPHQTTGNSPCTSPSTLPLPWRAGCLLYCQRVAGSKVKRWLRGALGGDTNTVTLEAIWNSQLRSIVFIMFLQFPINNKKKSPAPHSHSDLRIFNRSYFAENFSLASSSKYTLVTLPWNHKRTVQKGQKEGTCHPCRQALPKARIYTEKPEEGTNRLLSPIPQLTCRDLLLIPVFFFFFCHL